MRWACIVVFKSIYANSNHLGIISLASHVPIYKHKVQTSTVMKSVIYWQYNNTVLAKSRGYLQE